MNKNGRGKFACPIFSNAAIKEIIDGNNPVESKRFYKYFQDYIDTCIYSLVKDDGKVSLMVDELKEAGNYCLGLCLDMFDFKNSDVNFFYYFKAALRHEFINCFKTADKHRKMSKFSFDEKALLLSKNFLYEEVVGLNDEHIIGEIEAQETFDRIEENYESVLTDEERKVLLARMQDKTFAEIAKEMKSNEKHVRYIYARAKRLVLNND